MEEIQTFKGSWPWPWPWSTSVEWPWPWPWFRPYGIPSCITHRPLPIYQISLKSKKLFVDGRTDGPKKSQNVYISPICGEAPAKRIKMKICISVELGDIIMVVKFKFEKKSGIFMSSGSKFAICHWLCMSAYHRPLPRCLWWLGVAMLEEIRSSSGCGKQEVKEQKLYTVVQIGS